jgi:Tol biopolymer transport system component
VTVAEPVTASANLGWFSVTTTGLVAYRTGTAAPRGSAWVDKTGTLLGTADDLNAPSISHDMRFVAYDRTVGNNRDVWVKDLVRGGTAPLTRHPLIDGHPVWSPDGSQLAFEPQRNGTFDVWKKPSSDGDEEPVLQTPANEWPLDWSSDGRFLLVVRTDDNYASSDLLAVPMTGADRTPVVVAGGEFEERMGNFSPDVRWVAYETDQSGRPEVVVAPFQRPGGVLRVSTDGGGAPRWRADGGALYFIAPDGGMMAASVSEAGATLTIGRPVRLFDTQVSGQMFTYR